MDREEIRRIQRARIVDATIECVAERGYATATVGDIVARARVSRETFYELFTDKEDCYEASLRDTAATIRTAFGEAIGPPGRADAERLEAGLSAYFASLAARPAVAVCFVLERPSGREHIDDRRLMREQSVQMLCETFGWDDRFAVRAYLAMVNGIVEQHVLDRRTDALAAMLPELMPVARRVLGI